jgi:hypothetical protein
MKARPAVLGISCSDSEPAGWMREQEGEGVRERGYANKIIEGENDQNEKGQN